MKGKYNLGRWVLILAITAVCGLLAACDDNGVSTRFNALAQKAISETVDVTTQTALQLTAVSGSVEVTGSSSATRIVVSGYRRVYSDTEEDAQDRLQDLYVEVTSTDRAVLIETNQPSYTEGRGYLVDYVVTVPSDLDVEIHQTNGPIQVEDVSGAVAATTVNGEILASNLSGDAALGVTSGRIIVDTAVARKATLKMTTVNGNVKLTIPGSTTAWVSATAVNGRISYSGLSFSNLNKVEHALSGRLGTGEGTIELRTTNGNITLTGK